MGLSRANNRYPAALIFLHWLTFILFVATYIIIEVKQALPKGNPTRGILMELHVAIGVTILALVVCRLLVKWTTSAPPIRPPLGAFAEKLTALGHFVMYAVMLMMPITGYLMFNAGGHPVAFFGVVLPTVTGKNEALGEAMYQTHVLVSQLIYFLVAAHALLALWHHFVRRDNTLIRMMPRKRAK